MKSKPKIPFAVRKFNTKVGYGYKPRKINNIKYCITLAIAKNPEGFPVKILIKLTRPTPLE